MQLSERLEAIIDLAGSGNRVADVGTDHGYVPIELVRRGHFNEALAMDVRKGPLTRAHEHIHMAGLDQRVHTRLSDGLEKLHPGEADTIVIAGMGGALMQTLLEKGRESARCAQALVLSPQTEVGEFHQYILKNGFKVEKEVYVEDEKKIYVVMRCIPGRGDEAEWDDIELLYGRLPLRERSPILQKKLRREIHIADEVMKKLQQIPGESAEERKKEIDIQRKKAAEALARMK